MQGQNATNKVNQMIEISYNQIFIHKIKHTFIKK